VQTLAIVLGLASANPWTRIHDKWKITPFLTQSQDDSWPAHRSIHL
jgi:hypothetical protein